MIRKFCSDMELNSKNRPTRLWKNNLDGFATFKDQSMWTESVVTEGRGNCNMTVPNITRFDLNNNNVDLYPITREKIQSAMQRKFRFESKIQTSSKDSSRDNYARMFPPDSYWPDSVVEQTEPIDLSCMKTFNMNTKNRARQLQAKTVNYYFGPDSEITLPNTTAAESSVLILKSVYADIKYNRKPNCDQIFHGDPVDSKLYVCKVCNKRVRSRWHHFQTHYSRDHKCADCSAVYSRIDTLRSHAKKRHRTIIPRYYYGIPANIWHRVIVQYRGDPPIPKPPSTPKPTDLDARY